MTVNDLHLDFAVFTYRDHGAITLQFVPFTRDDFLGKEEADAINIVNVIDLKLL